MRIAFPMLRVIVLVGAFASSVLLGLAGLALLFEGLRETLQIICGPGYFSWGFLLADVAPSLNPLLCGILSCVFVFVLAIMCFFLGAKIWDQLDNPWFT